MNLVSVYRYKNAPWILYDLLAERKPYESISHRKMPSFAEHLKFFKSKPYRVWTFITWNSDIVGACYLTKRNEIGIFIFRYFRRKGYAKKALRLLMEKYKPLPAIPAERTGYYVANISPHNHASIKLFESLGFFLAQETYRKAPR